MKNEEKAPSHVGFSNVRKVIRFILAILMYSVCFIMILVFLAIVINFIDERRNLKNGITKPALFSAYMIVSPSMVPKINVLDVVINKRVNKEEEIKVGDIITFNSTDYRSSGVTVTHRVIKIEKTTEGKYLYTTKGDANNTSDSSRITLDDIYGKVLFCIPKIGYIQYYLNTVFGWIIVIIVPTLGIICYDIFKLVRTVKKDPKNKQQEVEKEKKNKNQKPKKFTKKEGNKERSRYQ